MPPLLAPAPEQLRQLTGVPTLAVLPMQRDHGLPEEDGLYEAGSGGSAADALRITVLAGPHISNLDEFQPLQALPNVRLRWARRAAEALDADWLILPVPSRSAATWPGCAHRAWMPCCGPMRLRPSRCWAFVAACRCWARRSPTRKASTVPRTTDCRP
jgi:hypothetical protein